MVSAIRVRASGVRAAIRPIARPAAATLASLSVATELAHDPQYFWSDAISLPQTLQTLGRRAFTWRAGTSEPLTSRQRCWVKRVGGNPSPLRLDDLAQSCRATHSAGAATARPHVVAVSESLIVNDPIRR